MHKVRENTRAASEARSGQILRFSVMTGDDSSNINTTTTKYFWHRKQSGLVQNYELLAYMIPHFSETPQLNQVCIIDKPEAKREGGI